MPQTKDVRIAAIMRKFGRYASDVQAAAETIKNRADATYEELYALLLAQPRKVTEPIPVVWDEGKLTDQRHMAEMVRFLEDHEHWDAAALAEAVKGWDRDEDPLEDIFSSLDELCGPGIRVKATETEEQGVVLVAFELAD